MSVHQIDTDANAAAQADAKLVEALSAWRNKLRRRLGEVLLDRGLISREALDAAASEVDARHGKHLGQILIERKLLSPEDLSSCLAEQFGIPRVELGNRQIDVKVIKLVADDIVREHGVVPLLKRNGSLIVATANPFDETALAAVRFSTGLNVEPVLAPVGEINELMSRYYASAAEVEALAESGVLQELGEDELIQPAGEREAMRKPIVRLVDAILLNGIHRGASDINIRPDRDGVGVWYRVDGAERFGRRMERSLLEPVVARIKILGRMNVAERRLPQDGRARLKVSNRTIDLRISAIPTVKGESVVIRVLDKSIALKPLDDAGFAAGDLQRLMQIAHRPNGLFLVTGPTGSGKSSTLNSMLLEITRRDVHLITVEDPVEYDIAGVEQIQVNAGIGFTFAAALRHILRHDPDVVMIGEIRDLETAQIANKAALTGHLVLSTLHTNDAASAVARMIQMGVEPYLLATTLRGVLAQRLVRRICTRCRVAGEADPVMLEALGLPADELFFHGRGCPACDGSGYAGRIVVYELFCVDRKLSSLIAKAVSVNLLKAAAIKAGMVSLTQSAIALAREGVTSIEEVYSTRLE